MLVKLFECSVLSMYYPLIPFVVCLMIVKQLVGLFLYISFQHFLKLFYTVSGFLFLYFVCLCMCVCVYIYIYIYIYI